MRLDSNLCWLLCRNLFFTILQPGLVVGLIPYLLLKDEIAASSSFQSLSNFRCLAGLIFLAGFSITADCILRFAVQGGGTLSPADPIKYLVRKGLYRFSRNPMYVGVLTIILGEFVLYPCIKMALYFVIIFTLFHVFVVFFEEPRLKKVFGHNYVQYTSRVRRWL